MQQKRKQDTYADRRRLVIFYLKCAAYKSTYLLTYLPYQTQLQQQTKSNDKTAVSQNLDLRKKALRD